jgi:hypothetical protein
MGASFSHAPAACEKNNGKNGSHLFFFLLVNDDILHEQRILDDHILDPVLPSQGPCAQTPDQTIQPMYPLSLLPITSSDLHGRHQATCQYHDLVFLFTTPFPYDRAFGGSTALGEIRCITGSSGFFFSPKSEKSWLEWRGGWGWG